MTSGNVTDVCISNRNQRAELNPTETKDPMEIVYTDYLTIESGK